MTKTHDTNHRIMTHLGLKHYDFRAFKANCPAFLRDVVKYHDVDNDDNKIVVLVHTETMKMFASDIRSKNVTAIQNIDNLHHKLDSILSSQDPSKQKEGGLLLEAISKCFTATDATHKVLKGKPV
eukprot:63111_1